jgi:hypothetical protein
MFVDITKITFDGNSLVFHLSELNMFIGLCTIGNWDSFVGQNR